MNNEPFVAKFGDHTSPKIHNLVLNAADGAGGEAAYFVLLEHFNTLAKERDEALDVASKCNNDMQIMLCRDLQRTRCAKKLTEDIAYGRVGFASGPVELDNRLLALEQKFLKEDRDTAHEKFVQNFDYAKIGYEFTDESGVEICGDRYTQPVFLIDFANPEVDTVKKVMVTEFEPGTANIVRQELEG